MIPHSIIDMPMWCEACGASWSRLIMVEGRDAIVVEGECAEGHIVLCPSKAVTVTPSPAPAPHPVPTEQW